MIFLLLRAFAESHDIGFLETSAKTGYNVEDTFQLLTQQIYDKIQVEKNNAVFPFVCAKN